MRFATFVLGDKERAGIVCSGEYYLLDDLLGECAPKTVLEFIREYEGKPLPDFESIIKNRGIKPVVAEVRLRAPIPMPFRNIICLGKNYFDHAKEIEATKLATQGADSIPKAPVYFSKCANPAAGNNDVIPLHEHFTKQVDYEVELAVIIGKTAKRIEASDAESVIFGYTVLNDVSARDAQHAYGQWFLGKSLDMFCPMGPVIVTKDEIPFPIELEVACRVNGETRQASNTSQLIYDIPRVISELSQGMTLFPGDIISTGTPGGVGVAMKPPTFLKRGDKVECEIEKIGVLTNYFE